MGEVVAVEELEVMSARRPRAKQKVEMVIPSMVRNWRCQPYEEFWRVSVCWFLVFLTIASSFLTQFS